MELDEKFNLLRTLTQKMILSISLDTFSTQNAK